MDCQTFVEGLETVASHGICQPGFAPLLDFGSEGYLSYIESEILQDIVTPGGATVRFFEGQYGAGKTHLLHLIAHRCCERGMVVASTDLSQAIQLKEWHHVVRHILEQMEIGGVRSFPAVVEWLQARRGESSASLPERLAHPGFLRGVKFLLERGEDLPATGRDCLHRFLCGGNVSTRELRLYGIKGVKGRLTLRNAELFLFTALEIIWRLSKSGTVVMFDENEISLASRGGRTSRPLRVAANLLRRLVDATVSGRARGALFVFAVLPGFVERRNEVYPALGQRVSPPTREVEGRVPWRVPYLSVEDTASTLDRIAFLNGVVDKIVGNLDRCGYRLNGCRERMLSEGQKILRKSAGSGYRRQLVKAVSTIALEEIG